MSLLQLAFRDTNLEMSDVRCFIHVIIKMPILFFMTSGNNMELEATNNKENATKSKIIKKQKQCKCFLQFSYLYVFT